MSTTERERNRFFRTSKAEGSKEQNEIGKREVNEGLDYIKIANEICDYDVLKFRKVYESVLLGDALIVYSRKIEEKNRSGNEKFKVELMKLEFLGKMITGEDIKLMDKYEEATGKKEKKVNEGALVKAGFDII